MTKYENKKLTNDQQDAINVRHADILVSAAAGSGKTAVLVERVISRILDEKNPIDVNSMLVVTFTEAAAAEMRGRIIAALDARLMEEEENRRQYLHEQMTLAEGAPISTLHSFCLRTVRQHYYRLQPAPDPAFRIADVHEAELLRQETLDALYEELYESDPAFSRLVDYFGGREDSLTETLLRIYDFAWSQPWPEVWLDRVAAGYDASPGMASAAPWLAAVMEDAARELEYAWRHARLNIEAARQDEALAAYAGVLADDAAIIEVFLDQALSGSWDKLATVLSGHSFARLPNAGKEADEDIKKGIQNRRKAIKDAVTALQKILARSAEEMTGDLRRTAPYVRTLVAAVKLFYRRFSAAKRRRCLLDFNDLEHFCLRLLLDRGAAAGELIPSDIALGLRRRFEEVLVDEYQDINELQEAILQLVSRRDGAGNLFMVGDIKQSVYRFRLAEPEIFRMKSDAFPDYQRYNQSAAGVKIRLTRNFRSRRQIIEGINFIFMQIMRPELGGVDYLGPGSRHDCLTLPEPGSGTEVQLSLVFISDNDGAHDRDDTQMLDFGAEYYERAGQSAGQDVCPGEESRLEVCLCSSGDKAADPIPEDEENFSAADDDEGLDLESIEREGRLIASRIRDMLGRDGGRPLQVCGREGALRAVSCKDIVILMRSPKIKANLLLEVLKKEGIPAWADLGGGYFSSVEVEVMLAALQVVDNPRQDIYLAAVLRSPLVGLREDDLLRIRLADRYGDYYDALRAAAGGDDQLSEAAAAFLRQLDDWRTLARRRSVADLVGRIYGDTGYLAFVGGLPGGTQRRANLRALLDRAREFGGFSRQGLFRFLRFIEKLRQNEGDLGTARALGEQEDVVRIMSIHKSKGLEFPVVFLADMGKRFNMQDTAAEVVMHRSQGLGMSCYDPLLRTRYPSLAGMAVSRAVRLDALAEEMRLLYVAMTRARERLILVGSVRSIDQALERWSDCLADEVRLPMQLLEKSGTSLDWVMFALLRHPGMASELKGARPDVPDLIRKAPPVWKMSLSLPEVPAAGNDVQAAAVRLDEGAPGTVAAAAGRQEEDKLRKLLDWHYPFAEISALPAKLKIKGIGLAAGILPQEEAPEWDDDLLNATTLDYLPPAESYARHAGSGLAAGRINHLVLQNLDLGCPLDTSGVRAQVDGMVADGLLSAGDAALAMCDRIAFFFSTALGEMVVAGKESLRREVPFSLLLPAVEVYPDLPADQLKGETVSVQGIIDCLLRRDDGYIIIDYKTDRLGPDDAEKLQELYGPQMQTYSLAAERISGLPVRGAWIYLLRSGTAVPMPLHRGVAK